MNTNLVLIRKDTYWQIKRSKKFGLRNYEIAAIVKAEYSLSKAQVEMFRVNPESLYSLLEN